VKFYINGQPSAPFDIA